MVLSLERLYFKAYQNIQDLSIYPHSACISSHIKKHSKSLHQFSQSTCISRHIKTFKTFKISHYGTFPQSAYISRHIKTFKIFHYGTFPQSACIKTFKISHYGTFLLERLHFRPIKTFKITQETGEIPKAFGISPLQTAISHHQWKSRETTK